MYSLLLNICLQTSPVTKTYGGKRQREEFRNKVRIMAVRFRSDQYKRCKFSPIPRLHLSFE
jgi:hypothetical protein